MSQHLTCTSPEYMAKLKEIEKASRWYISWTNATDKWFRKLPAFWSNPTISNMKAMRHHDKADKRRGEAYLRLVRVLYD